HPSFIRPCLGVHPCSRRAAPASWSVASPATVASNLTTSRRRLPAIEAAADRLIGVGEVGLDFTPRWCPDEAARETQKPCCGVRRAHLHAFNGRPHYAVTGAQLGYITFSIRLRCRDSGKQRLVAALPLDRLLLETDSPVLGPTVDQRNEPSNARLVLEFIAKDKAISTDAAAAALLDNTIEGLSETGQGTGG
uniref:Protein kinase domain-containing protein n=1 Tax=Macrostomum lignano TaxID=282301 RepID=A0A1I8FE00_9PLAT